MDVKMKKDRLPAGQPIPVKRALNKLGHDIRDARRRRRIPVAIVPRVIFLQKNFMLG